MARVSERVTQMKANFMELHSQGYTIPEIAIQYNLSWTAVYQHLQEIADENGVSREDLLMRVQTRSEEAKRREEERKIRIDVQVLQNRFTDAKEAIKKICSKIDEMLEEAQQDDN